MTGGGVAVAAPYMIKAEEWVLCMCTSDRCRSSGIQTDTNSCLKDFSLQDSTSSIEN